MGHELQRLCNDLRNAEETLSLTREVLVNRLQREKKLKKELKAARKRIEELELDIRGMQSFPGSD